MIRAMNVRCSGGKYGWGAVLERWMGRCSPSGVDTVMSRIVFALLFASTVLAQRDPVMNFCRRFGHQTAVIDNRLYIDGGLVNWNPITSFPNNYTNTYLSYQDLTRTSVDGMPSLYANLSKNNTIPDVSGGHLWADDVNKKLYLFGGEHSQEQPPAATFILYAYDALADRWESLGPPQQASVSGVSFGAGATVPDKAEGYYYGGWLSGASAAGWSGPAVATAGMVKYDMGANAWTNGTGPADGLRRAEGAMVYIPAGDGGMLVYLGGVVDPSANGTVVGQPMEQILLYDVLSSKWYTQSATGSIPGMRRRFCAGVAWTKDQSSYNIYVYGGASLPPSTAGYDDIHVLSLPSFTWTKLYPSPGSNLTSGSYPHHSLTCNVVADGAQMLIIGGTFPLTQDCDAPQQWGTHNVDLGQRNPDGASWQLFDPGKTGYSVPAPVLAVIGGSADGGATRTAPAAGPSSSGWDDPDLRVLMTRKASLATRTPTRSIPGATGTSSSHDGSSGSRPLGPGAIAGIAVGGGVGLAVLVLGMCCLARRHRGSRRYAGGSRGGATLVHTTSSSGPWPSYQHQQHWGSSPTTGTSPSYAPSPFLPRGGLPSPSSPPPQPQPAELVGTTPGDERHRGWDSGAGSGGGTTFVEPKMDDQGRMWMPQVSMLQTTAMTTTTTTTTAPSSPGSGGGWSGGELAVVSPGGVSPPSAGGFRLHRPGGGGGSGDGIGGDGGGGYRAGGGAPQELSTESPPEVYSPSGWDRGGDTSSAAGSGGGGRGRRRPHETYYHR